MLCGVKHSNCVLCYAPILRGAGHSALHHPRIPRNGNALHSPTLYVRGMYFAPSSHSILLQPSFYLGLGYESHKFFRIKSYHSNKSRPSAFEGKMTGRWRWRLKRRTSYLREAGVSDINTNPTPSKTQGQCFWYFSKKVHKTNPR